ncbi:sigma-54 factor interaction domain-containing protein [Massilia sp. B-10]|nr:sigma-54 factor interaction domain-containing protein [Massilia sp. B-10]
MATLNESLAAADLFGAVKGAYTGAQAARSGLFAEADGGTLFLDELGDTCCPRCSRCCCGCSKPAPTVRSARARTPPPARA